MMDNQQLWQATLGELELTLSRANFMTWFKNTFITTADGERVIVGVPNTFTKAWFEKKYHAFILRALQKVSENRIREVLYKVETGPRPVVMVTSVAETPAPAAPPTEERAPAAVSELGLNGRYTFDNFVIGKANELAHAACLAVSNKPGRVYNPLFVYGGVGLGKTHLLQAVGNHLARRGECKVLYVSSEKFVNDFIRAISGNLTSRFKSVYRSVDVLLVDDIQFLAGKEGTQEEFFHTFNALHQNNKQIVISSDRPPKAIAALEHRLVSRFEWGMIADIGAPDLETRRAILETKCRERSMALEADIIHYIAANISNNIRELEGALNRIVAYHQLDPSPMTLERVRKFLGSVTADGPRQSLTPRQIISTVTSYYDLRTEDIMGACRKKNLALPRQIIMYLMREETKCSYPAIGAEIGNRDHTTAMHAYLKITRELQVDDKLQQDLNLIRQRLFNMAGSA
ncbi:MAG: chromosomal replication initiator protein DnaA [Patescibacteria group bacterium]|nr:chromosomal replication initiator protein DnaA [Patescibacteria group bacterium]